MTRNLICLLTAFLLVATASIAAAQKHETFDPEEAKADPDFGVQGEYEGNGPLPDGSDGKIGAQVVGRGDGRFEVFILAGGLPGDGWKKGDKRVRVEAGREEDTVVIKGDDLQGTIADGQMKLTDPKGERTIRLKRVERKSPTLGAKPPAGATVLFDGTNVDAFDGGRLTDMETMLAGVTTKEKFGSYKLHLELRLSWMPKAGGQGRSNSGVYIHDCYEIQVLDSFGLEGRNNECGGFYKIKEPDVNMCFPPLVWQTYDIDFTEPKYDASGRKTTNARITVRHNGVLIHDDVELPNHTAGRQGEAAGPRPIHLQGHGNKVNYRNVWIQKK